MIVIRNSYLSIIIEKKYIYYFLLSLLLLSLLIFIAITSGAQAIPFNDIPLIFSPSSPYYFIITELRLPRILGAIIGGGLLAVSGVIIQAIIKNPLASPDIIGISAGGTLGAFVYILYLSRFFPYYILPIFTFSGSLLTLYLILFFLKNILNSFQIILTGIALNTLLGAIITGLMLFSNEFAGDGLYTWSVGSTYGLSLLNISVMSLGVVLLLLILPLLARLLSIHSISDDLVVNLGGNLDKDKKTLLIVAVLLSSLSVSYLGPVSFVGLIAPHCAKKIIPNNYYFLVLLAFIIGAILTLSADIIARTINIPYEYPLGVFTTLIGGPYFLYILFTYNTRIS